MDGTESATAPLPAEQVASALLPFGQSTMLPGDAYTSEAMLAWEQRHLFAGSWTCLGRTADLAASRTQCALTVGDVGVVLTFRGDELHALANTCRHRAHELVTDGAVGDRPALVCPYHGWSYELDGRLRAAPRMGAGFDRAAFGLIELPTAQWHGWLFVNATATANSFDDHVGSLGSYVAPYRAEHLVSKARHRYEVAANWKIIVENYQECYHCPQIHPELCAVTPPNSGDNWHEPGAWVGGSMDLRQHAETMSFDGVSHGAMLDGVDRRRVLYLALFPNLLLSLHPDYVMTHRLEPLAPDLTLVECEWLFDQAVADPSYAVDFWDLTNRQDWQACASVQRGVRSPHYRPGPLAPNETAVYDWVTMLARSYLNLPAPARP